VCVCVCGVFQSWFYSVVNVIYMLYSMLKFMLSFEASRDQTTVWFCLSQLWQDVRQICSSQQSLDKGENLHVVEAAGWQGIVTVSCFWWTILDWNCQLTNSHCVSVHLAQVDWTFAVFLCWQTCYICNVMKQIFVAVVNWNRFEIIIVQSAMCCAQSVLWKCQIFYKFAFRQLQTDNAS